MKANAPEDLTRRRHPRGRAVAAVLPGVFALMLAGVSGVAAGQTSSPSPTATPAAATSPSPTPTCHRHRPPYCPTPTPTPTPSPTTTPIASGGMGGARSEE